MVRGPVIVLVHSLYEDVGTLMYIRAHVRCVTCLSVNLAGGKGAYRKKLMKEIAIAIPDTFCTKFNATIFSSILLTSQLISKT